MSMRSSSPSSCGSASIYTTNTARSSIETTPRGDPGTFNFDHSIGLAGPNSGPDTSLVFTTDNHAQPWDPIQVANMTNFNPPQADINSGQFAFSPPSTFPYGTEFDMWNSPLFPPIYTPPGNGYGDHTSLDPNSPLQGLGASFDVLSEMEQNHYHVSSHLSNPNDFVEETSVRFSDPFPRLHCYTLLDDDEQLR
jgi:hypothetical protein